MAPDTPRRHLHAVPRYADTVPDGLTQIRKHPEPDRCDAEPQLYSDLRRLLNRIDAAPPRYDLPIAAPKPPTERGWWAHHEHPTIKVPHALFTDAINSIQHYDHLVDPRANDATFENEVRPR